jgi:phosphohistidine phosphatase
MGAFCSTRKNPPTLALCSPARRTRETCHAFREGLEAPLVEQVVENLYSASPETLVRAILEADNRHSALVVIGHNPGLQSLAIALGRLGQGPLFARLGTEFPPTALAIFETGIESWGAFRPESARLTAFTTPKDLT